MTYVGINILDTPIAGFDGRWWEVAGRYDRTDAIEGV
jgi:hypothetical protein